MATTLMKFQPLPAGYMAAVGEEARSVIFPDGSMAPLPKWKPVVGVGLVRRGQKNVWTAVIFGDDGCLEAIPEGAAIVFERRCECASQETSDGVSSAMQLLEAD